MKKISKLIGKMILGGMLFLGTVAMAQESKVSGGESKLLVLGTSNIHDWTVEAKAMSGKASFDLADGSIKDISSLNFSVEVEQLKSGKSGMDSNTFKALKSDKFKNISFKLVNVNKVNGNSIEAQGDLTIAGVTKRITQNFTASVSGKKVTLAGKQKINMTHYEVKPPTALLGTIKTGENVVVDFKVVFN